MGKLYEIINKLCEDRGIKPSKLCSDVGISRGLITDLKMGRKSGVTAVTAQKIASYFGVSVGYLLGEEVKKAPTVSSEHDLGAYIDKVKAMEIAGHDIRYYDEILTSEDLEDIKKAIVFALEMKGKNLQPKDKKDGE